MLLRLFSAVMMEILHNGVSISSQAHIGKGLNVGSLKMAMGRGSNLHHRNGEWYKPRLFQLLNIYLSVLHWV